MVFHLRRRFAPERVQIAAYKFGYAVMRQWGDFSRSDTDAFLPNHDLGIEYLQHCKSRGEKPERGFLTESIFPWLHDG